MRTWQQILVTAMVFGAYFWGYFIGWLVYKGEEDAEADSLGHSDALEQPFGNT